VLVGVGAAGVADRAPEAMGVQRGLCRNGPRPRAGAAIGSPGHARVLTPALAAEFDREWEVVLDRVKQLKDLADRHELLNKWRHIAYAEMRDPGLYYRMLSKAEQILRAGGNPDAVPFEEMPALIHQRQVG
jgi:Family of unknown function (DUF6247)